MIVRKWSLVLCLFCTLSCYASPAQEEVVERLYYTCKVWGYLKYHHSNVTAYNIPYAPVDWDDALLSSLDGIINIESHSGFHDSLNNLVNKAGIIVPYIDYWGYRGDSFSTKNFSWFNDANLPGTTKAKLFEIKTNFKNQVVGYFANNPRGVPPVPFIVFDNKYSLDTNPTKNLQILALFRYWNLIEYTYQYKPMIVPDWNQTLRTYIKAILDVKSNQEFIFVMKKLTVEIRDSRARFVQPIFNKFIGAAYLPFKLRFIEGKTIVVNKPDSIHEVSIGDELILIEEQPISMIREFYRPYAVGANSTSVERNIDEMICRGNLGATFLTFKKANGQMIQYGTQRKFENYTYFQNIPSSPPYYDTVMSEGCSFGIIDLRKIQSYELNLELIERIWNKDAWILDLRGKSVVSFEDFLIHYVYNDYKEYYFVREPNLQIPGEFYTIKIYYEKFTKPRRPRYDKKIILLVDEYTQESAEYFALCFKERENVMVIGSATDGAGATELARVLLPGNIYTTYTYSGAESSQKKPYYKIGVPIDSFVRPSVDDIRQGRDVVLEAALKCQNTTVSIYQKSELSFSLFPNPATDRLNVITPMNYVREYFIYNILGQMKKQGVLLHGETEINIENLSTGLYIFQAGNYSAKFVKE